MNIDLTVELDRLKLSNPLIAASGVYGYGLEYEDVCPPENFGAVVTKGISLRPAPGNPPPRIWETPLGVINAVGLENVGVEAFIEEKLPPLLNRKIKVIANFFGSTVGEYAECAARLNEAEGLPALEANISCPNVGGENGLYFGSTPSMAEKVVSAIRKKTDKFLIVKLTPQVSDIAEVARAVEGGGADALSLINTIPAMAVDIETRKPRLANVTGGLSGPAIHPVAVKMVRDAAQAVKIPVIGTGGVMSAADALEFVIVGAAAVQIGSALFSEPTLPGKIIGDIRDYLGRHGMSSLSELRGSLKEFSFKGGTP